jgi:hypothetical protein
MRALLMLSILTVGLLMPCLGHQPLPAPGEAVVVDVSGQEFKLTNTKLTQGTRRLAWLARADGITDDEKQGTLVLEIREPNSTTLLKGILTLIPAASLESVKYDYEKQQVSYVLKGRKEPVIGTLEYRGINVLGVSGSSDGQSLAFKGGMLSKTALKTITFTAAQELPPPRNWGTFWTVQIHQPTASDPLLPVRNLKVLYQYPGGVERVVDQLPIRKANPISFNQIKRFELLANDLNTNMAAAEIEMQNNQARVIAIPLNVEMENQKGTLVGFVGEVDVGWKLFPLHTIKVVTLTEVKKKID